MTTRYPGGLINKSSANTSLSGASGMWSLPTATQKAKLDQWPVGGVTNPLSYSLRFRSAASGYLSRTFSTSGTNNKIQTFSCWAKLGAIGSSGQFAMLASYDGSSNDNPIFDFYQNNLMLGFGGASAYQLITTQVFRDNSAWYHLMFTIDTTQATSSNRMKIYVNGSQVTSFSTANYPNQNATSQFMGANGNNKIGTWWNHAYNFFDGYLSEVNFIDGQALTPASFGQTNPITGVWEPIKYTGTYGTNGFYLPFNTPSNMGKDASGNNNNWTLSGFNTSTANTTYDIVSDVPTQWTPRASSTDTGGVVRGNYNVFVMTDVAGVTSGNLQDAGLFTQTSGENYGAFGTNMGFSSGKWYFEYVPVQGNSDTGGKANYPLFVLTTTSAVTDSSDSRLYNMNCGTFDGDGGTYMVAIDADNGYIYRGRNGAWSNSATATGISTGTGVGAVRTFTTGVQYRVGIIHRDGGPSYAGTSKAWTNFGQRPFSYTVPTGFKTICTTNLPEPTIKQGNQYFDAALYTGSGGAQNITGLNFGPEFVWVKDRTGTAGHSLHDAVRGSAFRLVTSSANAEGDESASFTGFTSNGFSLAGNDTSHNNSLRNYVAWCWDAASANTTNTDGSITSTIRANPTSGFSIVTYTGNGTGGATVGHGLNSALKMLIVKNRTQGTYGNWQVWHTKLIGSQYLELNFDHEIYTNTNRWNGTIPTSDVFSLGADSFGNTNKSGDTYVAYCFADVEGYSKFGSYTGNGSTDGVFVYCGFKPKYVMVKRTETGGNWRIHDGVRNSYNAVNSGLWADLTNAEATTSGYDLDLVSNGFKFRNSNADSNASGGSYIFAAFAEFPFKNALAR